MGPRFDFSWLVKKRGVNIDMRFREHTRN